MSSGTQINIHLCHYYGKGESWRAERLWRVVQSLTIEQVDKIAWLDDCGGTMVVGLKEPFYISSDLLNALALGWVSQSEYLIELSLPDIEDAMPRVWCEIDCEDPIDGETLPRYRLRWVCPQSP